MKHIGQKGAVALLPLLLLLIAIAGIALALYLSQNRLSTSSHADQTTCSSICNNATTCQQVCPLYIKDGSCPGLCQNPSACMTKCQQITGSGGTNPNNGNNPTQGQQANLPNINCPNGQKSLICSSNAYYWTRWPGNHTQPQTKNYCGTTLTCVPSNQSWACPAGRFSGSCSNYSCPLGTTRSLCHYFNGTTCVNNYVCGGCSYNGNLNGPCP